MDVVRESFEFLTYLNRGGSEGQVGGRGSGNGGGGGGKKGMDDAK